MNVFDIFITFNILNQCINSENFQISETYWCANKKEN